MKFEIATRQEVNGTSYHYQTVIASYNDLIKSFGKDLGCEWALKFNGEPFTIYVWRERFSPRMRPKSAYIWHIGSHSRLSPEIMEAIHSQISSSKKSA